MKQKVVRKGRNQPTRRRFLPLFCLFRGTPLSLSLSSRKGTAESREFEGCRPRLAIFRGFNQLYNCKPSPADLVCPFIINGKKFTLFPKAKVFANWVALRKSAVLPFSNDYYSDCACANNYFNRAAITFPAQAAGMRQIECAFRKAWLSDAPLIILNMAMSQQTVDK